MRCCTAAIQTTASKISTTLGEQSIRRVKFAALFVIESTFSLYFVGRGIVGGYLYSGCVCFLYLVILCTRCLKHKWLCTHKLNDSKRTAQPSMSAYSHQPPRKRCMHDSWSKQRTPDSFDMKTLFPSRTALPSQNHSFSGFTNSEKTRKRQWQRRWGNIVIVRGECYAENSQCEKSFQETPLVLYNPWVAFNAVERTDVFAEKVNHITL